MSKSLLPRLAALALCLAPFATAQSPSSTTGSGTLVVPAPPSILGAYSITEGTLQNIPIVPFGSTGYEAIAVFDGAEHLLRVTPHSVRAHDFKVFAVDASGFQHLVAPPAERTYQGVVATSGNGRVAVSVDAGLNLNGYVFLDGETFAIEPLTPAERQLHGFDYLVYQMHDLVLPGVHCGTEDLLAVGGGGSATGVDVMKEAEIAIDCDYDYYQRYNSNTTTVTNRVNNIINLVDAIYSRDVEITFTITQILIRQSATYSWNGDMGNLLDQFRARWNSQHGNIRRDMAHMFTGKGSFSGVIGIAWLSAVCTNYGYGVSKAYSSSNTSNAGLVAHECGHNFGANHCSGGSCYIMCAGLGGCGNDVTRFGTTSINAITAFKNGAGCLSNAQNTPPTITSLSPNTVTAAVGDTVTIQGTDLSTATDVTLNGQSIPYTVAGQAITFDPPTVTNLLPAVIVVSNAQGPSNPAVLNFTVTDPPRLYTTPLSTSSNPAPWEAIWGSRPGDLYGYAITLNDNVRVTFLGWDILLNGYILFGGSLTGAGTSTFTVPSVPSAFGNVLRSQIWVIDPVNQTFKASNVASTLFL
ncbi:MAG: IPT/TIG domain-containing protein [Planctomycetes bacterium]|nr:IPT/TIG domain-containing protein [Planctomycetota bacterium]